MRFAGSAVEDYFDKQRPDFGKMTQDAATVATKERNANNDLASQVSVSGINAQAAAESGMLKGEGVKAEAAGKAQAQMYGAFGDIGSSLLGSFNPVAPASQNPSDYGMSPLATGGWRGLESNSYYGTGGKYGNLVPYNP